MVGDNHIYRYAILTQNYQFNRSGLMRLAAANIIYKAMITQTVWE